MTGLTLLFALCCGHALADFPLQGEFLAKAKNRHNQFSETLVPGVWPHALTAHALIHAGTVWVITGSVWCGLFELVAHWWIDFAKCENWTGMHEDQTLHYICKVGYAVALSA